MLKGLPSPNPLVFLKGMTSKDVSHIIRYIYNGEVSIGQVDLQGFLYNAVALKIQGLDDESKNQSNTANSDQGITMTSLKRR